MAEVAVWVVSQGQHDTDHSYFCSPPEGGCGQGRPLEQQRASLQFPRKDSLVFHPPSVLPAAPSFQALSCPLHLHPLSPLLAFPAPLFSGSQAGQAARRQSSCHPLGSCHPGLLRAPGVHAARDHQAQWFAYFFSCRNSVHMKSYPKSQGWAKSLVKVRGVERQQPLCGTQGSLKTNNASPLYTGEN